MILRIDDSYQCCTKRRPIVSLLAKCMLNEHDFYLFKRK